MNTCPHCHKPIVVFISKSTKISAPEFDPSDPVQQLGYEHAEFNHVKRESKDYKRCPHPDGTDEFYRYNRGLWKFWNTHKSR